MWKSVKISQQTYFIYCNINANKEEVTLVLYDLKEAWYQTIAFGDVKLKVKFLNKRFDFNEDHIKEALTSGEFKFAAIEEQPHTSAIKQDNLLLKVRYGIKNCVLNYEWSLRKQSLLEFQKDFVQPLLVSLLSCLQQVDILTECIRKKDAELHQYRIEGAVLGRRTLATKPFDFDSFNKKYEESNKIATGFKELAQYVCMESKDSSVTITTNDNQPAKKEEKYNKTQNIAKREKLPPKTRKRRKGFELLHLERHLKLRKEGLQYESSQSQSLSSENSQTHEEMKKKVIKEKPQLEAVHNIKTNNNDVEKSQRKSTRNSPIKQKRENKAVVGTDSDSDTTIKSPKATKHTLNANLRSFRERRKNNSPENSKVNPQIKCLNIFEFSIDTEERNKSLQESQTESPSPIKSKNLIHSPLPPIIDDLSSQLNNIKKELECLEAMRLADLKKRSCKA